MPEKMVATGEEITAVGMNKESGISKEIREAKEWIPTLLVVATLIATISFAAPFAIPGGVSSDKGIPVRMHSPALKAFIITDTLALCFSMSVVILCFHVHRTLFRYSTGNFRFASKTPEEVIGVSKTFTSANILAQCAFMSTMVSYSFGLYVLIAPSCLWLAIFIFIAAWAVPFVGVVWQIALVIKLSRQPVLTYGDSQRNITSSEIRKLSTCSAQKSVLAEEVQYVILEPDEAMVSETSNKEQNDSSGPVNNEGPQRNIILPEILNLLKSSAAEPAEPHMQFSVSSLKSSGAEPAEPHIQLPASFLEFTGLENA